MMRAKYNEANSKLEQVLEQVSIKQTPLMKLTIFKRSFCTCDDISKDYAAKERMMIRKRYLMLIQL